ncbi:MAG: MFS transporter [Acidobacteria bacterium]|nr:MFS transporter [Acidobacteriota bacterium]
MHARSKIKHLRWYIAGLLFLATVINYVDRQTLSIVAPTLTKELHIDNVQYSNILQAFLVAYTFMYLVTGHLVDRFGTRIGLAVCMAWWSVANILHATATSAFGLGVFRLLLGAGESGNFLAAGKAISEWYPPKERGFTNGLVQAAASGGAVVAPPLVAWLLVQYGWRPAFVITGAMGLVWLIGWLWLYHLPVRHPRISEDELALIQAGGALERSRAENAPRMNWGDLLRLPQTWGLLLSRIISDPVWWFYLFWLPKYLADSRGFSIALIGMVAWMPYLAADLGSVAGGLASGYLIKRGVATVTARKLAMLPAVALMPAGMFIAVTPSATVAIALICLTTFCHMVWKTNLVTLTNDIYPTRLVGTLGGIVGMGSGLGGMLFTYVAGRAIVGSSYGIVFVIMGFLHPVALAVVSALVRRPVPEMDRIQA